MRSAERALRLVGRSKKHNPGEEWKHGPAAVRSAWLRTVPVCPTCHVALRGVALPFKVLRSVVTFKPLGDVSVARRDKRSTGKCKACAAE